MTSTDYQVAVIGAGPYGLAAAAHLRGSNVQVALFGRVMDFWKNHMPAGMLLRSPWDASHISSPHQQLSLNKYHDELGVAHDEPVSLERFVDYGQWFQRHAAPDIDDRQIVEIRKENGGFRLSLDDGQERQAARVVVATGIAKFAYRPEVFDNTPAELASHSSAHRDFKAFAGKEVAVIGRGQSALESAALLTENGADVELIVRGPKVRWLHSRELLRHPLNPFRKLFFHPTDVGPALLTQVAARPHWFKLIPSGLQPRFAYRCIRPAGAAWLSPRMGRVRISLERNVVASEPHGNKLHLRMDDGSTRIVDHALLSTGYRVDIHRHQFLAPALTAAIRCNNGYPDLGPGFESSVPGLHFMGAPAAVSFGPLMRFVSGTGYSAAALTRCITGRARLQANESGRRGWVLSDLQER